MQALTSGDAPWLAALHQAAMPAGDGWSEKSFAELLSAGAFGWQAQAQAFVLARSVAGECELLALVVDKTMRGRGLGAQLLGQLVANCRAGAVTQLFLEVAADNKPALSLYKKQGFLPVGQRPGYYASGQAAIVMALKTA